MEKVLVVPIDSGGERTHAQVFKWSSIDGLRQERTHGSLGANYAWGRVLNSKRRRHLKDRTVSHM